MGTLAGQARALLLRTIIVFEHRKRITKPGAEALMHETRVPESIIRTRTKNNARNKTEAVCWRLS